jgi:DNA replication protein DnaC
VGKTHLAVAIGREAIITGDTVLFTPAMTLVAQLAKAHAERPGVSGFLCARRFQSRPPLGK